MSIRHSQLDQMRLLAAFAVIALHVCALYVTGTQVGSAAWWTGNAIDSALRWCVPFFVMISGALLVPKLREKRDLFDGKRAARLLLPCLFWLGAYLIYHFVAKTFLLGEPYELAVAVRQLWQQPPHYHLWYLYMIIPLLFLGPLLARLASRTSIVMGFVLASAVLHGLQLSGHVPATPLWLRWLEFIPYFMLGHRLMQIANIGLSWVLLPISWAVIAWMTYQHCQRYIPNFCPFSTYYDYHGALVIAFSLPFFILLKTCLPSKTHRLTQMLTPLAFGIFLIHPVWIDILFFALNPLQYSPILLIPIIALVTLLTLVSAYMLSHIPYLRRVILLR